MSTVKTLLWLCVLCAGLFAHSRAEAAAQFNMVSTGGTSYSVTVVDLPDSGGVDLTVTYDKDLLEAPVIRSGSVASGTLMDSNVAEAGRIRAVFITGGSIKGSGDLATISFKAKGSGAVALPKIAAVSVFSPNGTQLAVQNATAMPQSTTESAVSASGTTTGNTSAAASTSTVPVASSTGTTATSVVQVGTAIGSVTMPQDNSANLDSSRREVRRETAPVEQIARTYPTEVISTPAIGTTQIENKVVPGEAKNKEPLVSAPLKAIQGVSERFRTHKEARALKHFAAYFDGAMFKGAGVIQTPALAVSDGKTVVKVSIELAADSDAPSFSLKGANQKGVRHVSEKRWELEALPQKGKSDVRLSVLVQGKRIEIPLTVVPPLDQQGNALLTLSDAKLETMLANPLKNGKPLYDLNQDGKQDYLDDYILTAYWLLKQQGKQKGSAQKAPSAK